MVLGSCKFVNLVEGSDEGHQWLSTTEFLRNELDNLAAEISATMITRHPDFRQLAAGTQFLTRTRPPAKSFSNTMKRLCTSMWTLRPDRMFR